MGAGPSGGGGGRGPHPVPTSTGYHPYSAWPNGETLGLPGGLNVHPLGSVGDLFGLLPNIGCGDFGACAPIVANDFLKDGVGGNGTAGSPWTYTVVVLASFCRTWHDGDFWFSNCGPPTDGQISLSEDTTTEFLLAGPAFAALDIGRMEAGTLFGTRFGGNRPLLNSSDSLRVGWSYSKKYGTYVFRIGGGLLKTFKDNPHINLWPPSWWGGPP